MTKRQHKTSARKQLITEAAIASFVENGIHKTSVRDIAGKAKISLGNLYNHFENKDALIAEIASLEGVGLAHFIELLASERDPLQAIRDFTNAYLDYAADPFNVVLTIEILNEALRNADIANRFEANRKGLVRALAKVIRAGIAKKQIDATLDVTEAVKLMLDAIEGLALRAGLSGKIPGRNARKALHHMIRTTLVRSDQ